MASQINPYNIDGTFPIAGQDNPSQGFRDNFTNIKNNLLSAANEITDLQSKVIVTSALAGQTITNDMAGTQIKRPQLSAWTQALFDNGAVSNAVTLDFNIANFQKITTAAPISVNFVNWPASVGAGALGYGVMRVWVVVSDPTHTLTLPLNVSIAVNDIAGYNPATNAVTFDAAGNYVFDFSSIDGGNTYLIFDVTRNRSTFRDPDLYYNPTTNSTFMLGYGPSLATALALEQGQDILSVHGSINSVGIGNLSLANVTYTQTDTGGLGGYSVTGARGNLITGTLAPAVTNDLLGYFNALTYTGTFNTANTFQQTASINFFAPGSNVTYGIGGNIAFFTAPDGRTTFDQLNQALSIESNQAVKTFAGIVEGGTYLQIFTSSGPNNFYANNAVSAVIIDSAGEITVPLANIILPSTPADRQTIKISTVANIVSANIYGSGHAVKFAPSTIFFGGNATVKFTYMASTATWYKS